ncbi:arginine--tRNA ligase [Candidatus Saccharibacteria bacterium]|nr:arginine--tRNA ligase [Candidatus Saccharibacteria bacterium]
MQELAQAIKVAAKKLFDAGIEPELTRPDERFGDYATNAALQLAKQAAKTPNEIAQQLIGQLQNTPGIQEISIAGPGFINFKLTDEALAKAAFAATELSKPNAGQEILVEFGDPNPFKEMHVGHLYTSILGDGISGLLEASGATVQRLSYHGDIGLHVAKWLWAVNQQFGWDTEAASKALHEQSDKGIGHYYSLGAKAYEEDEQTKAEIDAINNQVYAHNDAGLDRMYELGRNLSFDKFDKILDLLSISYQKRYLESQSAQKGTEVVKQNVGKVFNESQGAVVYEGEKAGLHTRVFLTSRGLPTYEAKDLGLAEHSIIITAHEQAEYFKVMLAALAEIDKPTADKTTHLAHGFLSLSSGKMSSRGGNVYAAIDLLLEVKDAVHNQYPDSPVKKDTTIAAVKYAFLKHRLGSDIVFDVQESISLEGNSGPYLQYAHARAQSILSKAQGVDSRQQTADSLDANERSLARKIGEYPEIIQKAVSELMPHHVANYLYELAQEFNRFYEKSRIIGDEREAQRLQLVQAYQQVLQSGLGILNIAAPERI